MIHFLVNRSRQVHGATRARHDPDELVQRRACGDGDRILGVTRTAQPRDSPGVDLLYREGAVEVRLARLVEWAVERDLDDLVPLRLLIVRHGLVTEECAGLEVRLAALLARQLLAVDEPHVRRLRSPVVRLSCIVLVRRIVPVVAPLVLDVSQGREVGEAALDVAELGVTHVRSSSLECV